MAFGAVRILDINGLSYLYTKLNNNITDFQNTSKAIIDSAAAAANSAADRANAVTGNIDSTYATKEELATAIGKITSFEFLIVSSLPNPGAKGTIYLVENTSGNQSSAENKNTYDEFIWVGSKYEKIGTTDINLSDYMKAADIADTYLSKTDASTMYATKGEVSTLDSKVDSNTASISSHSSNTTAHITAAERTNWNTAKTHADSTHARTDATNVAKSTTNGNIKINGTETTVYTHPSGTNPHGTTKSDVGLGNVGNYKAVSTVASQGLSDTEKSNARANIGAGTSSLTIGTTSSTAAAGNHTHKYAGSSSAGGVATSAAKLSTARNIALTGSVTGNANFDGSGNISISTTTNHTHKYAGSSSAGGSATSAVKLATARTITLSGAVTGSANFDGSANITITNKVAYGTSAPSSLADGSLYCVYE